MVSVGMRNARLRLGHVGAADVRIGQRAARYAGGVRYGRAGYGRRSNGSKRVRRFSFFCFGTRGRVPVLHIVFNELTEDEN